MGKPKGYSILDYGEMISEQPRMQPYVRALQQAIRPDSIVVDIGAGTGIFSLLACHFGAAEVHAIEPDASVDLARAVAAANGFSDRIQLHQTLSTEISLSQPADVIVSDLRGTLPLFQHHIASIADARKRLLRQSGVLIPARDKIWAALIETPKVYHPYIEPWLRNDYGLNLSAGQALVVNTFRKLHAAPDQLLVEPAHWATLDYQTIDTVDMSGELSWILDRPGIAHGLLVWFDAELAEGIGFSNRPGEPELIYGQAFFPFQSPVVLVSGDHVNVTLSAKLVNDNYIWRWDTQAHRGVNAKASFRQSTFYGAPVSMEGLKRRTADFVPASDGTAEIDRCLLSHIDGKTSLGTMAESLMAKFPKLFGQYQDALSYSANLAEKYRSTTNG